MFVVSFVDIFLNAYVFMFTLLHIYVFTVAKRTFWLRERERKWTKGDGEGVMLMNAVICHQN